MTGHLVNAVLVTWISSFRVRDFLGLSPSSPHDILDGEGCQGVCCPNFGSNLETCRPALTKLHSAIFAVRCFALSIREEAYKLLHE